MDIHEIRKQLKAHTIYDLRLRVTYYARVSSESDMQLNSLDNQIGYFRDLIERNAAWTFVEGYIDEGLSGMTTKKRDNFHRMIEDGEAGQFDLIITKEITRFARNTLDSIQYTRKLLSAGVGVFFQNDNINTFDEDSELRLTIMSGIAQDELRKLSSRVKFGHAQAIKNSVVLGNSRIFGYTKDHGRLIIDEAEAKMVAELFELYAEGQYSMKNIEDIFWERGYRNNHGKKISHTTLSGIISNPKYKGYYVGNKVKIIDLFTKKQKFLPPEEWVMFKDETGEIVPAIVSESLWEAANAVLKKRSDDVKYRQGLCNHANTFTGKLFCTQCGAPYYRKSTRDKDGTPNSKWVCSGKIKNGANSCDSFAIYESELKPILFQTFADTKVETEQLIERYIAAYRMCTNEKNFQKQLSALHSKIDIAKKKQSKLLGYNATGKISDSDFLSMNQSCVAEISEAEEAISELEQQALSRAELNDHISTLKRILQNASHDSSHGIINKEFVDKYIDKIFITPEDGKLLLQIKIFSGAITEKYLENLRCRTGHTFLTIWPPIEPA